jgi:hypothetical protein
LLPERFVRSLFVVEAPELIEAFLLGRPAGGRWTRSFPLERPVHPLMSSVLLGVTRFNTLQTNAQLDPSH